MKSSIKIILLWLIAAIILVSVFNTFAPRQSTNVIPYSNFIGEVKNGNVASVTISGVDVIGTLNDGKAFSTKLLQPLSSDSSLTQELLDKKVNIKSNSPKNSSLSNQLLNLLPWIILFIFWVYYARNKNNKISSSHLRIVKNSLSYASIAKITISKKSFNIFRSSEISLAPSLKPRAAFLIIRDNIFGE
jgi:ATP-dependent Zn protease